MVRLNLDLIVVWNDWRLMYVEGGVSCSAASAAVLLSGGAASDAGAAAAAAYLQSALQPALLAAWSCSGAGDCTPSLPAGVAPAVVVAPHATLPHALAVTVHPATPPPGADALNRTAALTASLLSILAAYPAVSGTLATSAATATTWTWAPVACTGADARSLPRSISLAFNVGAATLGGTAQPSTLDPASLWVPQFVDSINQVSDEEVISEFFHLFANGNVEHTQHFVADFAINMRLQDFPYDSTYFVATRRAVNFHADAIAVNALRGGFATPQQLEGWHVDDSGVLVCSMRTADGDDTRQCGPGEELSPDCQQLLVVFFRATRNSNYFMQNEMAPIVLVTLLSAAAYYNDLDAYEQRSGIMATALLSQMALQAYVSSSLPQTVEITLIHMALYTSYALMGFGIGFIVLVSYGLAIDIAAARRVDTHAVLAAGAPAARRHGKRSMFHARARQAGGEDTGVRHWQLRQYYREALQFAAILAGRRRSSSTDEDEVDLLYFPEAAHYALHGLPHAEPPSARRKMVTGDMGGFPPPKQHDDDGHAAAEHGGGHSGDDGAQHAPPPPYCPHHIWLRRALMEVDLFMRVGHLGIFALVMGSRYFEILRAPRNAVRCDNLMDFFAVP